MLCGRGREGICNWLYTNMQLSLCQLFSNFIFGDLPDLQKKKQLCVQHCIPSQEVTSEGQNGPKLKTPVLVLKLGSAAFLKACPKMQDIPSQDNTCTSEKDSALKTGS